VSFMLLPGGGKGKVCGSVYLNGSHKYVCTIRYLESGNDIRGV
jgi:hypothetical protein